MDRPQEVQVDVSHEYFMRAISDPTRPAYIAEGSEPEAAPEGDNAESSVGSVSCEEAVDAPPEVNGIVHDLPPQARARQASAH